MPEKTYTTVSVRMAPALARRLKKLAAKADRSTSWMAARLIENRIDIEESHVAAVAEGLESARKGGSVDAEEFFEGFFKTTREKREGKNRAKRPA